MISDMSPSFKDTWIFLEKRIEDGIHAYKIKDQVSSFHFSHLKYLGGKIS